VTTDGSDYADAIAPFAAEFAVSSDTSVILLEVMSTVASESRAMEIRGAAEEHLKRLARSFQERRIPTESVVGQGSPVNAILDLARRRHVDLIAMSTHGGAQRCDAAVGSVTQQVLKMAGTPLLMIRSCHGPRKRSAKGARS